MNSQRGLSSKPPMDRRLLPRLALALLQARAFGLTSGPKAFPTTCSCPPASPCLWTYQWTEGFSHDLLLPSCKPLPLDLPVDRRLFPRLALALLQALAFGLTSGPKA